MGGTQARHEQRGGQHEQEEEEAGGEESWEEGTADMAVPCVETIARASAVSCSLTGTAVVVALVQRRLLCHRLMNIQGTCSAASRK